MKLSDALTALVPIESVRKAELVQRAQELVERFPDKYTDLEQYQLSECAHDLTETALIALIERTTNPKASKNK